MVDSIYNNAASAYANASRMASKGKLSSADQPSEVKIGSPAGSLGLQQEPSALTDVQKSARTAKPTFSQLVDQSLDKARGAAYKGETVTAQTMLKKAELHEMVTAVNNTELTVQTVVAIRDRVVSAYQEIIKMPI